MEKKIMQGFKDIKYAIKSLDFIPQGIEDIINSIQSLDFTIPAEIFSVLDILTHCVGYIMPLRLHTPIITLVLGYWFILILIKSYQATSSFLSNVFSAIPIFSRIFKK